MYFLNLKLKKEYKLRQLVEAVYENNLEKSIMDNIFIF